MTKFAEIVAAVAREQGDSVVDLEKIKSNVTILRIAIDEVRTALAAGWVSADLAERTLQAAERRIDEEVASAIMRPSVADRAEQAQHRAEHRARRA
jgi:hypothetical protein